jgi:hypothetical protein
MFRVSQGELRKLHTVFTFINTDKSTNYIESTVSKKKIGGNRNELEVYGTMVR